MDKRVINSALDFLGNGGTLPDNPDVRRRFEFTAAMMKALFDSNEALKQGQEDMKVGIEQVLREVSQLRESPSLSYMFRYHTGKFVAAVAGAFLAALTGWFVLYALAEAFKLAVWFNEILHIPPLNG